jgi:hypothetical protein
LGLRTEPVYPIAALWKSIRIRPTSILNNVGGARMETQLLLRSVPLEKTWAFGMTPQERFGAKQNKISNREIAKAAGCEGRKEGGAI